MSVFGSRFDVTKTLKLKMKHHWLVLGSRSRILLINEVMTEFVFSSFVWKCSSGIKVPEIGLGSVLKVRVALDKYLDNSVREFTILSLPRTPQSPVTCYKLEAPLREI